MKTDKKSFGKIQLLNKVIFLLVLSLLISYQLDAQTDTTRYRINYYDKVFFSNQDFPTFTDNLTIIGFDADEEGYYFVQFNAPITRQMKQLVTDAGELNW